MTDGALAVPVRGVGEEDAAVVLRQRGAREVAVGLARDHALQFVALVRAGGVPQPVVGVAYDQRVRVGDPARVLDADQLLFGPVDLAPERGLPGAPPLAAGQQTVRDPGRRGAQLHLPVHGVGGQEDQ